MDCPASSSTIRHNEASVQSKQNDQVKYIQMIRSWHQSVKSDLDLKKSVEAKTAADESTEKQRWSVWAQGAKAGVPAQR